MSGPQRRRRRRIRRQTPQAFGRSVGANLVLAGSVFRSPGGLRLRAELIRVADNTVVLPVSAESATADALALQDELSLAIVNRLRLRGLGTRRYQLDPRLSATFLTARALQARRQHGNAGKAAQLFEQIIAADPEFAPAHAGLASALGAFSTATPSIEALRRIRACAPLRCARSSSTRFSPRPIRRWEACTRAITTGTTPGHRSRKPSNWSQR